jgi:hypothetical protein
MSESNKKVQDLTRENCELRTLQCEMKKINVDLLRQLAEKIKMNDILMAANAALLEEKKLQQEFLDTALKVQRITMNCLVKK